MKWHIDKPFKEPHTYIADERTALVACIKDHYENAEANAKLIAAAPELLEALKYVVKWHEDNDSGEGELFGKDYIITAINAINKTI